MGAFSFRPVPPRYDPRWMQETLMNLRNALMVLGAENFPNGNAFGVIAEGESTALTGTVIISVGAGLTIEHTVDGKILISLVP